MQPIGLIEARPGAVSDQPDRDGRGGGRGSFLANFRAELAEHRRSREPATRLLSSGEKWRPRTWVHFRRQLLTHLREEGAHSVGELTADPPMVLFLPLNRDELVAVLESARRRGLVVPLEHQRKADSTEPSDEWTITDEGRVAVGRGVPWLLQQFRGLPNWIPAVAGVLGFVGVTEAVSKWMETTKEPARLTVLAAGVFVLAVVVALLLKVRSRRSGAKARKAVARDWHRWRTECPNWYRMVFRPFPWKWVIVGVIAAGAASAAQGLVPEIPDWVPSMAVFIGLLPALDWSSRWDDIQNEDPRG